MVSRLGVTSPVYESPVYPEVYSEPHQTFEIEHFAKTAAGSP